MRPKILVVCNSRGRMLDLCLQKTEMDGLIWGLASDHEGDAISIARKHSLVTLIPDELDFSKNLLSMCDSNGIDYVISTGFTRIFKKDIISEYKGRMFNTHFSLLPAFPGHVRSDWTATHMSPRMIFERAMAYGVRIIGNTIHLIDESIDGGIPAMQSTMTVPYDEPNRTTRHRLFIQECRCFMQMVCWLSQGRVYTDDSGHPIVRGVKFNDPSYSPALEERWIVDFSLPEPR